MGVEHHLEWPAIAAAQQQRLASPAARQRLQSDEQLLPRAFEFGDVADAFARLDGLEALEEFERQRADAAQRADARVALGAELNKVGEIAPVIARARRGLVLDLGELAAVADVAQAADRIGKLLAAAAAESEGEGERQGERRLDRGRGDMGLRVLLAALEPLTVQLALAAKLGRSLQRDGDEVALSDNASPRLGALRQRARAARQELITAAERLIRRPATERALADRFWTEREGRVVLPVRSDAFSRAGAEGTIAGIIHGSSQSGRTLFVEPHTLVDLANAGRSAALAVEVEEERILTELSHEVGERAEVLERFVDQLVELDRVRARLKLSRDLHGVTPDVRAPDATDDVAPRLFLPGAKHPLMVLRGVDVVESDLCVERSTALVLSGPNAGGKTVALKTIGLCVLMVQAGLRIPTAAGAEVPLFRHVITDVGDDQSIAANLSTFSAHIAHVIEALQAAHDDGRATLVLFDEITAGTEPEQGAALAEAILRELVGRGATMVATTHYERLKLLATTHPRAFKNAAVGFDLARMQPTFRVTIGAPGSSSALAVARRLGLSDAVLDRAESLLSSERVRIDVLLREVEGERERLRAEAARLVSERLELQRKEAALARREQREEESAASKRQRAHAAATVQLRRLEDEIKARRKALRTSMVPPIDAAGVSDPEDRGFARGAREQIGALRQPAEPARVHGFEVTVGARVRVRSLGVEGEVAEVRGDRITVQLPLAKTTVTREDLEPAAARKQGRSMSSAISIPSTAGRHFGAHPQPVAVGIDNVVDIRGARYDEALTQVEVFLDRALASDLDVVVVRHGHGSGALRKAVREHLPGLAHVVAVRPGLPDEGGDAVTVVWLAG